MVKIVALIGEKFAGKDAAANYLVHRYKAAHIRFSHILDEILHKLDLPVSRRNEIDLGMGLRKIFGDGVLGHAIEKRVQEANADLVVVNGARMDEMKNLKKMGARTVYITAPTEVRFERYQKRHEKADDAVMSYEDFVKQDREEPTEKDIPKIGVECEFKIVNEGSLEELFKKINDVMNKII